MQERRNSIAKALELCLSCTNPSICKFHDDIMTWVHHLQFWIFGLGIHQSVLDSTHKGQVMQMFDIFFDYSEHAVEQTVELSVSWGAMMFMWHHRNDIHCYRDALFHYCDVIMSMMSSNITSLTSVYSTVFYSGVDQRKHQSSASLAFVWGIHRGPVNSPHKWPVTRKMFPFDDVIML